MSCTNSSSVKAVSLFTRLSSPVDENSLIRRVEPISRKMHRLYSRIKKVPDRSQKITRELYKKALAAKGLPVRFLPK